MSVCLCVSVSKKKSEKQLIKKWRSLVEMRVMMSRIQWRRQHGALGHVTPSTFNKFIFSSFWSKSDNQLSKYCVVCEISWYRCQQLTALSISTALVTLTKLLVIEQLLHPAPKFAVILP